MKNKQLFPILTASAAFLILILDSQTALLGASEGLELCLKTLIPSLFPFFVLSILLTGSLTGRSISILRPIAKLCKLPPGAESLLAIGLLGGYPVGAQNISIAYRSGQLSRHDAERMLPFCNNAGPAFIFGVLGTMFSDARLCWVLWGIHIFSALMVGILIPGSASALSFRTKVSSVTLPQAVEKAVKTMALVCSWVVLFRILLTFLKQWLLWIFPVLVQIILSGLLELSNGCVQLGLLDCEGLRFLIAGGLLSFGGGCIALQTASVCDNLSLHLYFPGKTLQCCISILLCFVFQYLLPSAQRFSISPIMICVIVMISLTLTVVLRKGEKISSNPAAVGV